MKSKIQFAACFILLHSTFVLSAHAQGTTFTYQGRLNDGASPANGGYDLRFMIFATNATGSALAEPLTNTPVAVSNGLFTVMLDFGANFSGADRWLEIAVRTNGANAFTTLAPRQQITPSPYAIFANSASNVLASAQLNVVGLKIQNNTQGAPNVIGGSQNNYVSNSVVGATIAGGGATNYYGSSYTNSVTGNFGTVSGGVDNTARFLATVGGGQRNTASGAIATVSGGIGNTASGTAATVGGGEDNTASASIATVGGGEDNTAAGEYATVSGGLGNTASDDYATVGGGYYNTASGFGATVGGGVGNIASAYGATVGGGYYNTASGYYSFAAGFLAQALHHGSFVWADDTGTDFASTANNQFSVRANGGVRLIGNVQIGEGGGDYKRLQMGGGNSSGFLYGSYPAFQDGIHLSYNYYADSGGSGHVSNSGGATSRISVGYGTVALYVGGVNAAPTTQRLIADTTKVEVTGTFNNNSDRNAKQDFAPVSASQILEGVLRLPVSEWSYKDDPTTRHIGPMAQDFRAVFEIGTDDRHIAPIDEGGLAFAAIQGLNEKVESGKQKAESRSQKSEHRIQQLEAQNAELKRQNNSLEKRLAALEQLVLKSNSN